MSDSFAHNSPGPQEQSDVDACTVVVVGVAVQEHHRNVSQRAHPKKIRCIADIEHKMSDIKPESR